MTEAPKRTERRRRSGQVSGVQIMFAAILSIGLILAINFSSRIAAGQPVQELYNQVQAEIAQLRLEQAELIRRRDYVRSDGYVEQWARSEGKMIRPGEVLVVVVPGEVPLESTPMPELTLSDVQTTAPSPEPWMVWWEMFFDSPPPNFE